MIYNLSGLSSEEVNIVHAALRKLPMETVEGVVFKLRSQVAQQDAAAQAVAEQANATKEAAKDA